jgi:hypothetical protein
MYRITQLTFIHCEVCKEVLALPSYELNPGCPIVNPTLPEGWHEVDGQHVCPKHSILVFNKAITTKEKSCLNYL